MQLDRLKDLADSIIKTGLKKGADTVQVIIKDKENFEVSVRNEAIETLIQAESNVVSITLAKNKKKSSFTSSDLKPQTIDKFLDRACELLDFTEEDEFFCLPDKEDLFFGSVDLKINDSGYADLSAKVKIETAMELEKLSRKKNPELITESSSVNSTKAKIVSANSAGFCNGYEKTMYSVSLSLVANDFVAGLNSNRKQNDGWYSVGTHWNALSPLKDIADMAINRTIRKLGAKKPLTQSLPVVFEKNAAADFISGLAAAANGINVYKRQSFLADLMNVKVGSELFTLVDDPLINGEIGSKPFDSEGVSSREVVLFEKGTLRNFVYDTYSAKKLNAKPTGAKDGFTNLYLQNGSTPPEEMVSGIKKGILITAMIGQGANIVTGGYSRGAQGIWIEDGKLLYPLNEFTIASTFADIIKNISMMGDDLEFNGSTNSPSFKVDNITISGI